MTISAPPAAELLLTAGYSTLVHLLQVDGTGVNLQGSFVTERFVAHFACDSFLHF